MHCFICCFGSRERFRHIAYGLWENWKFELCTSEAVGTPEGSTVM